MVWLVKDCCGIACVLLAWLLMGLSQYTILNIILLPQPDSVKKYANLIVFEIFFFLALVAHIRTILTDPGSVPQKTATTEELMQDMQVNNGNNSSNQVVYKCAECCSVKPDRAHHCSVCKRCIRKMDHHCPWVNNCVGERNQKFFILFTLFIAIISFHAFILAIGHFVTCLEPEWSHSPACPIMMRSGRPSPGNLILLVFLTFEGLLFSLFSMIMFSIQLKAVWTDWTGIENLKKEDRSRSSGCANLHSVFGRHFLCWFCPFSIGSEINQDIDIEHQQPRVIEHPDGIFI